MSRKKKEELTSDHLEHIYLAGFIKGVHAELRNKYKNSKYKFKTCLRCICIMHIFHENTAWHYIVPPFFEKKSGGDMVFNFSMVCDWL